MLFSIIRFILFYTVILSTAFPQGNNVDLLGQFITRGNAVSVFVEGNYAYIADAYSAGIDSLLVVDVSDAENLTQVGSILALSLTGDISVVNNLAYLAASTLIIVDISNPSNPLQLGEVNVALAGQGLFVSGNFAYVSTLKNFNNKTFTIFDVSIPSNPILLSSELFGSFGVSGRDVFAVGNTAYLAADTSGLRIINVTDPSNATEIGVHNTPGSARGINVTGDYAYIADGDSGLRIIDVSVPSAPNEVGFYDTPGFAWSVQVLGDFAYIADGWSGIRIIDISDPTAPISVGNYDFDGHARSVFVSNDGKIYVTTDQLEANGLFVFKGPIATVTAPSGIIAAGDTSTVPTFVTVSDLSSLRVNSAELVLTHDSSLNAVAAVIDSTTLPGQSGWTLSLNNSVPGQTSISMSGANTLSNAGALVNLFFAAAGGIPGDSFALDISSVTFNEGIPFTRAEPGTLIVGTTFGDVSRNGEIQAFDAALIFQFLLDFVQFTPLQENVAELSGDDLITEFDASLILQFVVGLIDSFPNETGLLGAFPALGSLAMEDVTAIPGETFDLNISLEEGEGIYSGSLVLNYDSDALELLEVMSTDLTGEAMVSERDREGTLQLLFAGTKEISGEGSLFTIRFKVKEGAIVDSDVMLTNIRLNEEPVISEGGSARIQLTTTGISGVDNIGLPESFSLSQNYPNPFNPTTNIRYGLPLVSTVNLTVYDLQGRLVRRLVDGTETVGFHDANWDGKNSSGSQVSSGIYIYRLVATPVGDNEANRYIETRKLLLLR